MFERYTEKARRIIFFARYEANQYGSTFIDTQHLLLGLMRESFFVRLLPRANLQSVRTRIDARTPAREKIPTRAEVYGACAIPTDLPLSNESKRVLVFAAEEADRLAHKHIGTEHLFLGLLREENCLGAQILRDLGADSSKLREEIAKVPSGYWDSRIRRYAFAKELRNKQNTVEIHGSPWNPDYIRDAVGRCRQYSWHWQQRSWAPRNIVINRQRGTMSFDLSLAEDAANFELVKAGWKRDHCAICRWELYESEEATHKIGYSNGRDWLCTECYEKFLAQPDFFSSPYPDIT
ncbi:MAG: hypothetical protein DMG46_11740 [Acidobacteria bacterium]|nr:MAG: hypothetical protein DMG46_11740 [Acidobacteriota bacterium]